MGKKILVCLLVVMFCAPISGWAIDDLAVHKAGIPPYLVGMHLGSYSLGGSINPGDPPVNGDYFTWGGFWTEGADPGDMYIGGDFNGDGIDDLAIHKAGLPSVNYRVVMLLSTGTYLTYAGVWVPASDPGDIYISSDFY